MKKALISTKVLLGAMFMVTGVYAETKVVSKWGADTQSCGPGATPCLSISHAISLAAPNDLVLVHPGVYLENVEITTEGLQLTSLSGRSATVIVAPDPSADVVTVSANNVRVGSKANGFSVEGGNDGIRANNFVNITIEGNRASGNFDHGFEFLGTDAQVRYNIAENNTYGFYCDGSCTSPLIQRNIARFNSRVAYTINSTGGAVFNQNIADSANIGTGIYSISGNAIIHSNVSERSQKSGIKIDNIDGTSIRGNILFRNTVGLDLNQSSYISSVPVVKHNMSVANTRAGIEVTSAQAADFDSNTAIQNDVGVDTNSTYTSFSENTTYDNTTWGLSNGALGVITLVDHFLSVDEAMGSWAGNYVAKPNLTKVGIAKGLGY